MIASVVTTLQQLLFILNNRLGLIVKRKGEDEENEFF